MKEQDKVFFSLVIATLNRKEELAALLQSLLVSDFRSFEVIIVDQNDDDRLSQIISSYDVHFPLKHIRANVKNACKARNAGIAHSSGHWVTFPDDDCCYTPRTLTTAKEQITNHNDADIILGAVTDFNGKPITNFKKRKCRINLFNMNGKMSEAAIFSKKSSFSAVGGFDEDFGPGGPFFAAEGYEFITRAMKAGQKVYFDSSIQILHPNKTQTKDAAAFHIGYTRSFGVGCLLKRHFGLWAVWFLSVYMSKFVAKMILIYNPVNRKYAIHCFTALTRGLSQNLRRA